MPLTGFDAPVEQVMYIDKKLREHHLLQAIARVNRVAKAFFISAARTGCCWWRTKRNLCCSRTGAFACAATWSIAARSPPRKLRSATTTSRGSERMTQRVRYYAPKVGVTPYGAGLDI
jgi:hypothetical protein